MRKYYPGITLFKLLGALLVLLGHVAIPRLFFLYGRVPGLQQATAAIVPCFYIISGFLAYRGWTGAARPAAYVRRYLGGLALVYAVMCGVAVITGNGTPVVYYAPGAWHNAVLPLVQTYLVYGPYGALWFIPPLLFGVTFCYYFERRGWLRWAVVLAGVGFLAAQAVSGTLRVLLEAGAGNLAFYHWHYATLLTQAVTRNLGWGVPFVLAGVLVARHEAAFMALAGWRLAFLTLGGLALEILVLRQFVRGTYTWLTHPLILALPLVGLWLFYGVLHLPEMGLRRYQAASNRFSALLYFLHQPLLALNLSLSGWAVTDMWNSKLTTGQITQVMALTIMQAGLLTWGVGRLLARRPAPRSHPPADLAQPGQLVG
ncbi:acyltransferase family protein [Hymenobacter cheonanensis]|uniref:acyltransferase family protein n=1 Tax=Hymenobacter sp. CA2-7 TaxID=3063993 RepID=UPI002712DB6C|nr:acyltransferase family protein [Hymenobacter sp. CA2-7]MDO7884525.1 acyltransferase family protein [Hymenobacter sp. CA2-7]